MGGLEIPRGGDYRILGHLGPDTIGTIIIGPLTTGGVESRNLKPPHLPPYSHLIHRSSMLSVSKASAKGIHRGLKHANSVKALSRHMSAPPADGHLPGLATSTLLRTTRESALKTPGIRWDETDDMSSIDTRKMNMFQSIRDAMRWAWLARAHCI